MGNLTAKFGEKTIKIGNVYRSKEMLRGSERETIVFAIATKDVSFDTLHKLVADEESLKHIVTTSTPVGDSEAPVSSATFENYIVPGEPVISVSREVIDQTEGAQPEEVFMLKLGKLTYIEEQLKKLGINPLG